MISLFVVGYLHSLRQMLELSGVICLWCGMCAGMGTWLGVRSLTVLPVAAIISWTLCIASKDYCLLSTVSLVAHVRKGSESGVSGSRLDLACVLPFRRLWDQ